MNYNKLLLDVLGVLPVILLTTYTGVYLGLYLRLYRELDHNRDKIRKKIASNWTRKHKTFIQIIDNIPIDNIRVLLKPNTNQDKLFRVYQGSYAVLTVMLFLYVKVINNCTLSWLWVNDLLIVVAMTYAMVTTVVFTKTYYEYKYYDLMDKLNRGT